MNSVTSYRRWRRRRLGTLGPALLGAGLLTAYLAVVDDLRPSVRIALIAVAGLVAAVCLLAAALTLACDRLHRRGLRADARARRQLLEPAERLVAPAILLLLPVALAPGVFRLPERELPPVIVVRASQERPARPLPPPPAPDARTVPPPAEEARPEAAPETIPLAPPPAPRAAPDVDGADDNEAFRLRVQDLEPTPWPAITLELRRLGVPDDEHPLEGRPFSVELDMMVLWADDAAEGSGISIRFDLPTPGGPILRLSTLYLALSGEDEVFEGDPTFALSHTTLDAVFRIVGGTRRAALDLYVSAGLAVDAVDAGGMDSDARLSPHLAVDLAVWQTSRVGFLFHAGQTIPTSATGGAAAISELAATVRVDVTERISLRAGWRHVIVHLRDYEGAFDTGGPVAEMDRDLSGPFVGLEVRF